MIESVENTKTARPRMIDVARIAGVSIGTVSATFRGQAVKSANRKKVLAAAKTLGYRPNVVASNLAANRTRLIGIVMPWNNVQLIDTLTSLADESNYEAMLSFSASKKDVYDSTINSGRELKCVEKFIDRRVEGIILLPECRGTDYGRLFAELDRFHIPFVCIDRHFRELDVDSVVTDNRKAATLVVEHLYSLGHKRIAFISELADNPVIRDRADGFRGAMVEHGIFRPEYVLGLDDHENGIAGIVDRIQDLQATAVFASSDILAYQLIGQLRDKNIKIPENISVVGFDDMMVGFSRIGELTYPKLTTIRQNFEEIASRALEMLILKIEKSAENMQRSTKIEFIKPELIVRDSSGQYI